MRHLDADDLVAFGTVFDATGDDTLEFLFGSLSGSSATDFGPQILVTLTGEFGDESDFFDIGVTDIATSLTAAPVAGVIPLPGAAPLMLGGLILLGGMRLRTR